MENGTLASNEVTDLIAQPFQALKHECDSPDVSASNSSPKKRLIDNFVEETDSRDPMLP